MLDGPTSCFNRWLGDGLNVPQSCRVPLVRLDECQNGQPIAKALSSAPRSSRGSGLHLPCLHFLACSSVLGGRQPTGCQAHLMRSIPCRSRSGTHAPSDPSGGRLREICSEQSSSETLGSSCQYRCTAGALRRTDYLQSIASLHTLTWPASQDHCQTCQACGVVRCGNGTCLPPLHCHPSERSIDPPSSRLGGSERMVGARRWNS
jgi:hypothetical protein